MFQVVSARYDRGIPSFECKSGFEHLAVPFWPTIPSGIVWPLPNVLTRHQYAAFCDRWTEIRLLLDK
jgi:hypothetical protein